LEKGHDPLPFGHILVVHGLFGLYFLAIVLRPLHATDVGIVKILIITHLSILIAFILTHFAIV
jgi:hypothetical protein